MPTFQHLDPGYAERAQDLIDQVADHIMGTGPTPRSLKSRSSRGFSSWFHSHTTSTRQGRDFWALGVTVGTVVAFAGAGAFMAIGWWAILPAVGVGFVGFFAKRRISRSWSKKQVLKFLRDFESRDDSGMSMLLAADHQNNPWLAEAAASLFLRQSLRMIGKVKGSKATYFQGATQEQNNYYTNLAVWLSHKPNLVGKRVAGRWIRFTSERVQGSKHPATGVYKLAVMIKRARLLANYLDQYIDKYIEDFRQLERDLTAHEPKVLAFVDAVVTFGMHHAHNCKKNCWGPTAEKFPTHQRILARKLDAALAHLYNNSADAAAIARRAGSQQTGQAAKLAALNPTYDPHARDDDFGSALQRLFEPGEEHIPEVPHLDEFQHSIQRYDVYHELYQEHERPQTGDVDDSYVGDAVWDTAVEPTIAAITEGAEGLVVGTAASAADFVVAGPGVVLSLIVGDLKEWWTVNRPVTKYVAKLRDKVATNPGGLDAEITTITNKASPDIVERLIARVHSHYMNRISARQKKLEDSLRTKPDMDAGNDPRANLKCQDAEDLLRYFMKVYRYIDKAIVHLLIANKILEDMEHYVSANIPQALEKAAPGKPDKPQGIDAAFFDKLQEYLDQSIVSQIRPAATTSGTP